MAVQVKEKSRLRARYSDEVLPALMKELNLTNPMEAPRLEKVVVNVGVGEATQNSRALDAATQDLTTITGQKPIVRRAKRSIAQFRLRAGMPVRSHRAKSANGSPPSPMSEWNQRPRAPIRCVAVSPIERSWGAARRASCSAVKGRSDVISSAW